MKKKLSLFSLVLFTCFLNAQTWTPVGNGLSPGGNVNTLFVHDSVMYVGGLFSSPGNNIAQLNGNSTWSSLSSGINNQVYVIGLYKDTIYIGGWFTQAGGHSASCLAKWDGKDFSGLPFNIEGGQVSIIHTYDSLLYIGGRFDSINHKRPSGLVTWDEKKVDSVFPYYWYNISILTTYKNSLLLGFGPEGNLPVESSKNRVITDLGNDYFYSYSPTNGTMYMNAFCQVDTNLYMGGSFLYFENTYTPHPVKDTVNNIAMWNGKKWSALGKGIHGTVNALVSYNNLIVAGGSFDSAGGVPVNNIAAWNGTSWSALGGGINGTVYALAVFDSNLYAGGSFASPGYGIAEFTQPVKIAPAIINNDSVNVFPNPNTGQFTVVCNRTITTGTQPIIEIYNLLGEKIYTANLYDGNTAINLEGLSPGIYIYRINSSGDNLINPGKLIIE